jgi:penicillin V acylase-like amidase (Ntn superfamily)
MRKIKTKGLKFKVKPVDRGPRFAIVLHSVKNPEKAKEALQRIFEITDSLAEVVVGSSPVLICRDLEQSVATDYVKRMKDAGDARVWLESAAPKKIKQMNLKRKKGGQSTMPAPRIRKH